MSVRKTVQVLRSRIERGYMPNNLDHLLDMRGTIETAAMDLSVFTGFTYEDCMAALREVYL